MSWTEAETKWNAFLNRVEAVRSELNCTWSNAWFRGVEASHYELLPTLLRLDWLNIPEAENPLPPAKLGPAIAKVSSLRQQLRNEMNALRSDSSKATELAFARIEYWKLKNKEKQLKEEATRAAKQKYAPLLRLGERDAFINYQFRSGITAQNSWQILTEMQHHKVPTRLLDWTDVLSTALYFALERFRKRLEKYWFDLRKATRRESHSIEFHSERESQSIEFPPESVTSDLDTPALWILNPYYLARYSSKRDRIWDLTLDPHLDYYKCFIEEKKWPFEYPIPIYSPWKDARIAAQRGMFLVWGYERGALEDLLKPIPKRKRIVRRLRINRQAAIYGVKHIRQLLGMDRFAIYRDLDALGAKVRREFLRDTKEREEDFD